MTDINKELRAILINFAKEVRSETLALGNIEPSYMARPIFSTAQAKIKALVVEQLPQEKRPAEMTLNMNEIQVAEYDSEIIGFNQCLGEIRSIYE